MKITKIETISLAEFPNVIWIQVHTDAGHVGLGETFFGSQAIHAYVHETLAPQMLAKVRMWNGSACQSITQLWSGNCVP